MKASELFTLKHAAAVGVALLTTAGIRLLSQGPFNAAGDTPIQVEHVSDAYAPVVDIFKANFERGEDVGAGVAAYVDGELVLDVQGGWQDVDKAIPYTKDTLQLVYSSTKMLTAIVVAQFVQKGVLSYDEKIAAYWPEFAQNNKENITLGDLMQHAAGVGCLDRVVTLAEVEDPEQLSRILASQPHTFGGERKRSYHSITAGWYINEILKRTAGCTVDTVAASYMDTYGIEWRLKPHEPEFDDRITRFHLLPGYYELYNMVRGGLTVPRYVWRMMTDSTKVMARTIEQTGPDAVGPDHVTDRQYRRIEAPSYSGYTNARSIAKLAAMMANGGKAVVAGEPDLISADTYALATEPMPPQFDLVLQMPIYSQRGGFATYENLLIDGVKFTGWGGYGGSVFFWNSELKIGFGFVTNAMLNANAPDIRSIRILEAIVKQAKNSLRRRAAASP